MAGGGGGGKEVEAPEGEYADPTGLSGTYYATSHMPYGDGKKVVKVVKLEYKAASNAVVMHAAKGEQDPSTFYMEDWMKFARDNYGMSQFKAGDFHLFTVEPGVVVLGDYMRAPADYPGKTDKMCIADTSMLKPVIFVKEEALISKYPYPEAKRVLGERGTLSEIANTLRLAEKTPLPSIGKMTADKQLIAKSVELMKAKWASSPEPTNFQGCYIHSNDWGTVQYGKIMSSSKTTFSDEVTAIMLFKNPDSGICYYYAIGISRESEDFTHQGMTTERGLHMTGNSTIQYITKARLEECLSQIAQ